MSQEDVRQLLIELGGQATFEELVDIAQRRYPDRTLYNYVSERLQSMGKKGLVTEDNGSWKITKKGKTTKLATKLENIDDWAKKEELESETDISIKNIVASCQVDKQIDLQEIDLVLNNSNYHPESTNCLNYIPNKGNDTKIMVHSTGRLMIVGASSKQEIISGVEELLEDLRSSKFQSAKTNDIYVSNIVATYDVMQELDLSAVSIGLGLGEIEYDPEEFPGLIYRSDINPTIILYRSGQAVITGAKSYGEVIEAKNEVSDILNDLGLD